MANEEAASEGGRPERKGFDRSTTKPSLSGNLVCKTYAEISPY
jgi:hypothetical protein